MRVHLTFFGNRNKFYRVSRCSNNLSVLGVTLYKRLSVVDTMTNTDVQGEGERSAVVKKNTRVSIRKYIIIIALT